MGNELGAVYTPPDLANLLAQWAINSPNDKILDLGVGEGAFVFSAYERLIQLGAKRNHAQKQIFGSEVNPSTFKIFLERANYQNLEFPNIVCNDFFETKPFEVDSLVGNPPYVRRHQLTNQKVHKIQAVVKKSNTWLKDESLSNLTDLYVYFLLHALPFVKNNGRIAVVVADSWLNVRYGRILKKYLKAHFKIDHLISFDRKIFEDAQVKALLLFATRTEDTKRKSQVSFTRVLNGLPIKNLESFLNLEPTNHNDLSTKVVQTQKLDCASAWAVHLKSPHLEDACKSHQLFVPLKQLGFTRIGIQSLANDFFLLSPDEAKKYEIEDEYLEPFAQSIAYFDDPVIKESTPAKLLALYCDKPKAQIKGTMALDYIETRGEQVFVKQKDALIKGYHNKTRIQRANRKYWYDIKSNVERRGRAPILIPRLIYRDFCVLWNQADFIPGGAIIEFIPTSLPLINRNRAVDIRVYLAVLNSSLFEVNLRSGGQVYGGGTNNISVSRIGETLVLNVLELTIEEKHLLIEAYEHYITNQKDRSEIDRVVFQILNWEAQFKNSVLETLEDLLEIAYSAKMSSK